MPTYYCRICWNENGWICPSGPKRHEGGYAEISHFGHEEWLFNFNWIIEGYHHAFLRVGKTKVGESLDLLLWTFNPEKKRCMAGRITKCEVLKLEDSQEILEEYKKRGWFRQMQDDVEAVGGNKNELDYPGIFNIRFKREDVIPPYIPPIPFDPVPEKVAKCQRYVLMEVGDSDLLSPHIDQDLEGIETLPLVNQTTVARKSWRPVSIDMQEMRLQRKLMELLQKHLGENAVTREGGFGPGRFDLVVKHGQRTILIELKAYSDAKMAIREALGQLLEYTFFYPQNHNNTKNLQLFIVAPVPMNEAVSNYINLLRDRFSIPIHYCSFTLNDPLPKELIDSI
jgi:hypothetical protein